MFRSRRAVVAVVVFVTFGVVAGSLARAESGQKDHYQFGPTTLCGVIVEETRYGAPNFENDGVSRRVRVKMLKLDRSIAVDKREPTSVESDPVKSIRLVQIVELGQVDLSSLVGKRVAAAGELDGARTGHHYTRAILLVDSNDHVRLIGKKHCGR
jgi:hypothetical protein